MSLPEFPETRGTHSTGETESSHVSVKDASPLPIPGLVVKTGGLRKPGFRRKIILSGGVLLAVVLVFGGILMQRVYVFASTISPQSPLSSQMNFSGSNRLNVLVLVYDGGQNPGAYITDAMLIISIQPQTGQTVLISVPRDLGIHLPVSTTRYFKIDTVYETGLLFGNGAEEPGQVAGGNLATHQVTEVTGLRINYWMTLAFQGFRQLVDALGGVDITVRNSFTGIYPRDDSSSDSSYITVHFSAGLQHMDSERAIEYARTRQVLDNPSENSDFARSARQHQLVKAIVTQMMQLSSLLDLFNEMNALQNSIYTNLSAHDLYLFARKVDTIHTKDIVLSTQNVLQNVIVQGGLPILLPEHGNYGLIQQYIQQQLGS